MYYYCWAKKGNFSDEFRLKNRNNLPRMINFENVINVALLYKLYI